MRSSGPILPSLLPLLLLALLLFDVPATAGITLSVGAVRASESAADDGSFGSAVRVVQGESHATGTSPATALVTSGALPCLPSCGTNVAAGAHAFGELDGDRMRFSVRSLGFGAEATNASAGVVVSDTLSLVGWGTPGIVDVELHVRVELAMDVDRGSGSQAAAAYTYFLDGPEGGFGDLFAYGADMTSSAVPDPGQPQGFGTKSSALFEVLVGGETIESGSTIPPVYETVVTIPVAVGVGLPNRFGFVWSVGAGGFTDGGDGQADVDSIEGAYLGISVSRGGFTSANGYRYPGYVPEPGIGVMLVAGVSALGSFGAPLRARFRRPATIGDDARGVSGG